MNLKTRDNKIFELTASHLKIFLKVHKNEKKIVIYPTFFPQNENYISKK